MATKLNRPWRAIALLAALVPGCALDGAHDRIKAGMQHEVGLSAEDKNTLLQRYPESRRGSTVLQNGNVEQQFHFRRSCEVFFEIDARSRKIVGWRYEGTVEDCGF